MSGYLVLINPTCLEDADALLLRADGRLAPDADQAQQLLCHVLLALVNLALEEQWEGAYR